MQRWCKRSVICASPCHEHLSFVGSDICKNRSYACRSYQKEVKRSVLRWAVSGIKERCHRTNLMKTSAAPSKDLTPALSKQRSEQPCPAFTPIGEQYFGVKLARGGVLPWARLDREPKSHLVCWCYELGKAQWHDTNRNSNSKSVHRSLRVHCLCMFVYSERVAYPKMRSAPAKGIVRVCSSSIRIQNVQFPAVKWSPKFISGASSVLSLLGSSATGDCHNGAASNLDGYLKLGLGRRDWKLTTPNTSPQRKWAWVTIGCPNN